MKLIKNNEIIELDNENHVAGFLDSGWKIYEEPVQVKTIQTKRNKNNKK